MLNQRVVPRKLPNHDMTSDEIIFFAGLAPLIYESPCDFYRALIGFEPELAKNTFVI